MATFYPQTTQSPILLINQINFPIHFPIWPSSSASKIRKRKKMSVASSSFSSIKIPNSSSSPNCTLMRFSTARPITVTVRSSQAEGPIRRPVAPVKPIPPRPPQPSPPPPAQPSTAAAEGKSVITIEFQRQKAKELQEYFKQRKAEEANQGPFFGFIGKNEISNGRWAMFGFAVGMLTEYATGSDFVDQVKILLSNFGILDLE